jgi:uncharacterized repeat protein (TIGR03803 family)
MVDFLTACLERRGPWLRAWATVALSCAAAAQATQPTDTPAGYTYEVVHEFVGRPQGRQPYAGVIEGADGALYGTTAYGGKKGVGVVYRLGLTGDFDQIEWLTYAKGATPEAELVLGDDGHLYGTTPIGGANMTGTVFRLSASGEHTVLHSFGPQFGGPDGAFPRGLAKGRDGSFYGVTPIGGNQGFGTAFRITPTGEFVLLHEFGDVPAVGRPGSPLVIGPDGAFYGVADHGPNDRGAIYRMTTDGIVSVVYAFSGWTGALSDITIGPSGDVFGATSGGGDSNLGAVYRISGGEKTILHSFAGTDGLGPEGAVTLTADGRLFGTTQYGGPNYHEGHNVHGVVYRVRTDGKDFHVVHSFKGGYQDGARPTGRLLLASDGRIFGTTTGGGAAKNGVIFALSPR